MGGRNENAHTPSSTAPSWENLLNVVGLAADWIWELDADLRVTQIQGNFQNLSAEIVNAEVVSKAFWDLDFKPIHEAGWDHLRGLLSQHQTFRDVIFEHSSPATGLRFYNISGTPVFDDTQTCIGFRGIGKDITDNYLQFETSDQFFSIVNESPDCVFLSDLETHYFVYANRVVYEMTGITTEILKKSKGYEWTGQSREYADRLYDEAKAAGLVGVTDKVHFAKSADGSRRGWWEPHHRAVKFGDRWYIITVSREITSRVLAEQAVERAKQMYAALSETSKVIMRARTPADLYQGVCNAAVRAGGLTSAAIYFADDEDGNLCPIATAGVGEKHLQKTTISVSAARPEGHGINGIAYRSMVPCISNDFQNDERTKPWHQIAKKTKLKSGASIPIIRQGRAIGVLFLCADERRVFDDEIVHLLQQVSDNLVFGIQTLEHETDREIAEERVRYLATHDSLTGLPNRSLYGELLDRAIALARRNQQKLAVMFIDLDRFKLVNDSLGHSAGDTLLREMSNRLRKTLRESDVLARLGGDEFVILLHNINSMEAATTVARKLLDTTLSPIHIMGQECRVTASIGVSIFPDHGQEHHELMKQADTAMYLAKEKGKNTFEFYVPGMQSQSTEKLALEAGLRNAIANDELYLQYQAKLNLKTNQISGVEALLRWKHPTLGIVSPQKFIPLCEENGMIVPIGRWVLNTACKQNVEWQRQGLPPITMAVNLSARQFADPELLADIRIVLDETGMNPKLLELELTESMVMLNPNRTIEILTQLRALGVRIALDDFGVGYSSLAQIKGFPIDTLKVDRSFIRNLPESNQDCAITKAIINMARSLSLTVIAEGVETEAQEKFLRNLSCDESQGFYFSKPASAEDFVKLLRNHGIEKAG